MVLAAGLILLPGTVGATEDKLPVLQVGAMMYTNVTVTTKAKNYIFIVHDGGMTSIKGASPTRAAKLFLRAATTPAPCSRKPVCCSGRSSPSWK